jgi:hypothetical protein
LGGFGLNSSADPALLYVRCRALSDSLSLCQAGVTEAADRTRRVCSSCCKVCQEVDELVLAGSIVEILIEGADGGATDNSSIVVVTCTHWRVFSAAELALLYVHELGISLYQVQCRRCERTAKDRTRRVCYSCCKVCQEMDEFVLTEYALRSIQSTYKHFKIQFCHSHQLRRVD